MRFQNTSFALLLIIILVTGCNTGDRITIRGYYPEGAGKQLYVSRIDVNTPVFVDSVKVNKSGSFKLNFSYKHPDFYNIGVSDNDFITLIAYPGDNIKITVKGSTLYEDYFVEGSRESEDIRMLDLKLAGTLSSLDSLATLYDDLPEDPGNDERRQELESQYTDILNAQRMHNISFILDNINSFASVKALFQRINENAYVLYKPTDAQYLKLVSDSLNAHYPGSRQAIALAQNLEKELEALNLSRISRMAEEAEPAELDLDLKDISGRNIKLSSFENKSYVLLSFWSAESNECISNNIQLKEFYKTYHSKGFEIYQVNLDQDEELWKRSVAYDELPWVSVREDDPVNALSIIRYNITKVPANYLIDMNGEVIAKDLFGRTLQIKLSQIFD